MGKPVIKKQQKSNEGSGLVKDLNEKQMHQLECMDEENAFLKEKATEKETGEREERFETERILDEENVEEIEQERLEGNQHEEDNKKNHKLFTRGR